MKLLYRYLFILPGLFIFQEGIAQESCKVLMPSIAGTYEGGCKKGKANGEGKAEGTDQYLGEFKDGLPHGQGVYRWKNGNFYDGEWANGKKDGNGGMAYRREGKTDSVVTGFWRKDVYVGKNEKPFKVYNRTSQISKVEVKFAPSPNREIQILLSNTTGNMPNLNGTISPKAILNDIAIATGSYARIINQFETNKQTAYKLESVIFPFRAKFRIGGQEVDVEFLEEGKYTLDIGLNN
jgi:hypothetical protein